MKESPPVAAPRLELRRVEVGAAGARLEAAILRCGDDLVVVVGGGARPHVGAAALGLSVPSLSDPARRTASSGLLPVPGHKEEELAREGSLRLARALGTTVVVTVGIHDDALGPDGIRRYRELFDELLGEVEREARPAAAPPPRR